MKTIPGSHYHWTQRQILSLVQLDDFYLSPIIVAIITGESNRVFDGEFACYKPIFATYARLQMSHLCCTRKGKGRLSRHELSCKNVYAYIGTYILYECHAFGAYAPKFLEHTLQFLLSHRSKTHSQCVTPLQKYTQCLLSSLN